MPDRRDIQTMRPPVRRTPAAGDRSGPAPDPGSRPASLHRRIWIVGAIVVLLAILGAAQAEAGYRTVGSVTAQMQSRQHARQNVDQARRDLFAGQAELVELSAAVTRARAAAFPQALQLRQQGIQAWRRYERQARRWTPVPQGMAAVDSALAKLESLNAAPAGPPPAAPGGRRSGTAPVGPPAPASPTRQELAVAKLASAFTAVQVSDDRWWSDRLAAQRTSVHDRQRDLILTASVGVLLLITVIAVTAAAARRRDRELHERDRALSRAARSNELEARLQRALEMASTESRAFRIADQALGECLPQLRTELLLADSSRAHFRQILSTGLDLDHHCGVESPAQCPAAQRGQVLDFPSSGALDACPYLKEASPEPRSATCVPVSIGGMTYGVVHAAAGEGRTPGPDDRARLELIARRVSERIGMLRAFDQSQLQASTDPLTGLANRRTLEQQVRGLSDRSVTYAVAFADLDHFKQLNDTFGHGAGDRALRLFAQVLKEALRPTDLAARYGGEEFVVVLPGCTTEQATEVLNRIRARLKAKLDAAGSPQFTVSFGLANPERRGDFEDVVALADVALLAAKAGGRDRVMVSDDSHPAAA